MRAWLALVLVAGCALGPEPGPTNEWDPCPGPQDDPNSGEIDGTYLDPARGACFGGVGGAIRCAGSPCEPLDEATCRANGACFVAYTEDDAGIDTFRSCLPIDTRSLAAGECTTLTADACVTRPDCAGVYQGTSIFSAFVRCEIAP